MKSYFTIKVILNLQLICNALTELFTLKATALSRSDSGNCKLKLSFILTFLSGTSQKPFLQHLAIKQLCVRRREVRKDHLIRLITGQIFN